MEMKNDRRYMITLRCGEGAGPGFLSLNEDNVARENILDFARDAIGCDYVEVVHLKPETGLQNCLMLIDEEGKLKLHKMINAKASALAILGPNDYIAGDVLIVKEIPEDFTWFGSDDAAVVWKKIIKYLRGI